MSEERQILADTVTRLFGDLVTKALHQSVEQGTWPADLWQAIDDNGLPILLVPEAAGGVGGGWQDAEVVVRAAGRAAVPLPLPETMLANWLLARAGIALPGGALTVAPHRIGDQLTLSDGGLSGTARRVPWGRSVGHVVAIARGEAGNVVILAETAAATRSEDRNLALEPRDTLTFDKAPVVAVAPLPDGVPDHAILSFGAFLRAAQIAGALDVLLTEAVSYAKDRQQFGQPIGKFQAIQQALAQLAGHAAATQVAVATAARAADKGGNHDPGFEIACAKARASEASGIAASISHQTHGAIGFTYEHHLHFASRRAWSWRAEFGNEAYWNGILGQVALEQGADQLWGFLAAR